MTPTQTLLKSGLVVFIGHVLNAAAAVATMPLLIAAFGVANYGAYILITSIISLLVGISPLGVGFRCKRSLPTFVNDPIACGLLFWPQFCFNLASAMILGAGLFLSFGWIQGRLLSPDIRVSPHLLAAFLVVYIIYGQVGDYFRYTMRVGRMVLMSVIMYYGQIAMLLLLLSLYQHGKISLDSVFMTQIAVLVAASVPFGIGVIRETSWKQVSGSPWRIWEDIALGFPLMLGFLVDYVLSSTSRYALAVMTTVEHVAWFNAAYTVGTFVCLVPRVIGVILPPLMSRSVDAAEGADARKLLNLSLRIFFSIGIPFTVGCLVLDREVLQLVATAEIARSARFVTPLVALGSIFYGINIILGNVLFVTLQTKIWFRLNIIAMLVVLLLNFGGLFWWKSVLVPGVALLAAYFVSFLVMLRFIRRFWPVIFGLRFLLRTSLASLIMGVAVLGVKTVAGQITVGWFFVLLSVGTGVLVYGVAMLALGAVSSAEIGALIGLLAKKAGVAGSLRRSP